MKKNMFLTFGIIVFVLIVLLYFKYYDILPPRTPLKVVRLSSKLNIPNTSKLIDFKENHSITGEGDIFVSYKLDEEYLILLNTKFLNYKTLSVENLIKDKLIDPNLNKRNFVINNIDLTEIKNGLYKLEVTDLNKQDYSISLIDLDKKIIIVYISLP